MKNILIPVILALFCLFACKKSEVKVSFDQIDLNEIKKYENQFSAKNIIIADQEGKLVIKPGTIIFYKTNLNAYGKLRINSLDNVNHDLHCDMLDYNTDGSILTDIEDIVFSAGNGFDLDADGALAQDETKADFMWTIQFESLEPLKYQYAIIPQDQAIFFIYSN